MQKIFRSKPGLILLILLPLLLAILAFFMLNNEATAPDVSGEVQLNLGRSNAIRPIEQVVSRTNLGLLPPTDSLLNSGLPSATPAFSPIPTKFSTTTAPAATPSPNSTESSLFSPSLLAPGSSFPTRLEIPSARITSSVVQTYLDKDDGIFVPLYQVGHYIDSARPGQKGNMVMVGHVRRGLVFNRLVTAKLGDTITVYDETNTPYNYRVAEITLVPVSGAGKEQIERGLLYLQPTTDERLTLVTCYPETTYADRLLVIAVPAK